MFCVGAHQGDVALGAKVPGLQRFAALREEYPLPQPWP